MGTAAGRHIQKQKGLWWIHGLSGEDKGLYRGGSGEGKANEFSIKHADTQKTQKKDTEVIWNNLPAGNSLCVNGFAFLEQPPFHLDKEIAPCYRIISNQLGGEAMQGKVRVAAVRMRRGFTLIELAIAIVIIGTLITGVLYFTGGLGRDAKAAKIVEAFNSYLQAYQVCKLKNAALTITDWTSLETAIKDSQCRTTGAGVPDGNGLASNIAKTVAGVQFDIQTGTPPLLTANTGDTVIASRVVKELQGQGCTCNGAPDCTDGMVRCPLQ